MAAIGAGQWYLHLFDTGQPDWDWRNPDVPALFEDVIRFWLDRGVAGVRVDVAHGLFKDPDLPDVVGRHPLTAPSAYRHRPELQPLYRSWRAILDSYPTRLPRIADRRRRGLVRRARHPEALSRAGRPAAGLQLPADPGGLAGGRVP